MTVAGAPPTARNATHVTSSASLAGRTHIWPTYGHTHGGGIASSQRLACGLVHSSATLQPHPRQLLTTTPSVTVPQSSPMTSPTIPTWPARSIMQGGGSRSVCNWPAVLFATALLTPARSVVHGGAPALSCCMQ